MLRFFKKKDKHNDSPSKWKNIDSFTLKKPEGTRTFHWTTTKAEKKKNQHAWFYKIYADKKYMDCGPSYELEAISSELYRFILGTERAAKSRVVANNENASHLGVISAENSEGFKDVKKIWEQIRCEYFWQGRTNKYAIPKTVVEITQSTFDQLSHEEKENYFQEGTYLFIATGDKTKDDSEWAEMIKIYDMSIIGDKTHDFEEKYLTYENGMAEINMAMRILDEHDAGSQNLGVNNKNEIARIDYDFTLNKVNSEFLNFKKHCKFDTISQRLIPSLFVDCESKIPTDNQRAKNRFYLCQLMTLLLDNEDVISLLCKRHTTSQKMVSYIHQLINKNVTVLYNTLYESEGFVAFVSSVDFELLKNHFERIFKHENKYSNKHYEQIMFDLEHKFEQIKKESYSQLSCPEKVSHM